MKTPQQTTTTAEQTERPEPHRTAKIGNRTNKNTIFDVYKYMNDPEYSVLKYTGTKLIQTFENLGYQFEVRLSKNEQAVLICIDGLIYSRTTRVEKVLEELKKSETWYLQLNWTDAAELLTSIHEEKKVFLADYLWK